MYTCCRYATILAFDVKIERDAQDLADTLGVKIFQADIIYHLFDKFMAYREELRQKKRDEFKHIAVFPCKLKILPQVCTLILVILIIVSVGFFTLLEQKIVNIIGNTIMISISKIKKINAYSVFYHLVTTVCTCIFYSISHHLRDLDVWVFPNFGNSSLKHI